MSERLSLRRYRQNWFAPERLSPRRRRLAALAIPVAVISWAATMGSFVYMFAFGRELLVVFLVPWLFFMPALFFLLLGVAFPLAAVTASLDHVAEVTAHIANTERRLGPVVCAGRIGRVNYGGPMLRAVSYTHLTLPTTPYV